MGKTQRSRGKRAHDELSDDNQSDRYRGKYCGKVALKKRRSGQRADQHAAEDSSETSDDNDTAQHRMDTRSRNTAHSISPVTGRRSRKELKRLANDGDAQATAELERLREAGRNSQATMKRRAEAGEPSAVASIQKGNQRRHDLSALRTTEAKLKSRIDSGDQNAADLLAAQHDEYRRKYPRSTLATVAMPLAHDQLDELQQASTAGPPDYAFHITPEPTAENRAAESEEHRSFARTIASQNVYQRFRDVSMDIAGQRAEVAEPDNHQDEALAPGIAPAHPHGLPLPTSRTSGVLQIHDPNPMPIPTESNSSSATGESGPRNAIAGDDSDCNVIGSTKEPQVTLHEASTSIYQGVGSFRNDDEDTQELMLQIARKKAEEERLELELRLHRQQKKARQK